MSISSSEVPFLKSSPYEASAGGFESAVQLPGEQDQVSQQQKIRAEDLFLRGILTKNERVRAQSNQSGFEAVIGRSNFLPAVFLEVGAAVSRATCLIRSSGVDFLGRTGRWTGTGALVSKNILLTNNHVLNSRQVAAAGECVFDFQLGVDGQPVRTHTFRMRPDRLFITSEAVGGLDYTFVWVDGEPGEVFGSVKIDRNAFMVAERDFANVIGHPAGRMKEVSLQKNTVLWQDNTVVHYTSDTEHGSSGASVANNEWKVFALHHANKPTQVGEHTVLNEGIKLSAIAAHLEQIAQTENAFATHAREALQIFHGVDEELGFFGTLGRSTRATGSELEAVVDSYSGNEQDIDVGFWNVEWLSNRWETKTKDVAQVIHSMNLDVWCLEESSPSAAEALVSQLRETYDLDYSWAPAESESPDNKQSCTILWNNKTVACVPEDWGEPINTWLNAHSRDFDNFGFEAVHGKIFNRFPRLFKVTAHQSNADTTFDFYLVPLHLKAKQEGSLRRRMAGEILAAAVQRKIESGADGDWIVAGDVNAEIASGDFAELISGGLLPVSARDEQEGAFTYLKFQKSMIDHVFLSPNLSQRFGPDSFFVVAADREFPNYVSRVSDHRPVLLRMSLKGETEDEEFGNSEALTEIKEILERHDRRKRTIIRDEIPFSPFESLSADDAGVGFEGGRADFSDREGFDESFLGEEIHQVPLPAFVGVLQGNVVVVDSDKAGRQRYCLDYMHFSIAMHAVRRFPIYSAVNINGNQLRGAPRKGWKFDPRIDRNLQSGNEIYEHNDLDKGHMTRRLDPVWGTPQVANIANRDSMFYTNAVPQHKDLNQKEWVQLEDYVLENSETHELKLSVMTGPVFRPSDKPYRGILIPEEFWKVVVMCRTDTDELSATGYLLTQKDLITGFEFIFGEFKTYQVTLADIESRTSLDFGRLREFDPKARGGGFESASQPIEVDGPATLQLI